MPAKKITPVTNPFSEKFSPMWELWKEYKQEAFGFKYKSYISEQMALKKLVQLSLGNEDTAIAIIEQSIADQWEGLYALKIHGNGTGTTKVVDIAKGRESLNDAINKRFGNGK